MPIGVLGPDGGPSGSRALVESVGRSLQRLTTLPPHVLGVLGARLQASHPGDRAGPEALSTWPEELQALARQLYAHGLRAHLLPYYGPWMWETLDVDFDLSRTCSTAQFQRALQGAFRAHGRPVSRLGSHSLRRGRAAELFHGGIAPADLSRVLRHLSPQFLPSLRPRVSSGVGCCGCDARCLHQECRHLPRSQGTAADAIAPRAAL